MVCRARSKLGVVAAGSVPPSRFVRLSPSPPSLQNYPDMNGNFLNKICTNTSSPPLLLSFCSHPFPGKEQNNTRINAVTSLSVSYKLKAIGAMDNKKSGLQN